MADILASVSVVLGAEVSGFKAAMAEARKELKGLVQFSEGLKDVGSNLTSYVSGPIALLGVGAVAASAKLESLKNGLQAIAQQELGKLGITGLVGMQVAAQQTGERLKELQVIAKAPGLGLETAEQADIRLRAVGTSAQQSAREIKAFANAIATTGGGRTEFQTVTTQLAQMTAKGKVLAQDLRPIIEAAPAVAAALQTLYGTVDSEDISKALAKQGQSSKDFVAILTTELEKLPKVTGGLKAIYENDLDALLVSSAKVGDGIAKAFNLQAVGEKLGNTITAIGDGFANLSAPAQAAIVTFAGLAAATGPVLLGLGTLGVALPAIKAGFVAAQAGVTLLTTALETGFVALLNPVTIVVAALAALAIAIYRVETAGSRALDTYREQAAATRELTTEVSPLLDRYDELRAKTALTASEQAEMKAIVEKVTAIMPAAGQGLDDYGNYLGLATTKAREFIAANQGLEKAIALQSLPEQTKKLNELSEQYAQLVEYRDELNSKGTFRGSSVEDLGTQFLIDFRQELATSATELEKQKQLVAQLGAAAGIAAVQFDALGATFPGLAANLAKLGTAFPVVNITGVNGALASQVRILETLKARLKEVQEQRDKETTVKAIKVDNTEILSLQKQIAALEGTDKAAKKGADAIAKLRQELTRLTALDRLLGDTPNQLQVLERRSDTLVKGLKTLVDAGVSTSSKAFQGFAADLVRTSQAADRLIASTGQLGSKTVSVKSLIPQSIGDTLPQDVARLLGDYAKQTKPFELPVRVKLNMEAITEAQQPVNMGNFEVSKDLYQGLLDIGNGYRQASAAAQVFGVNFDEGQAKANTLRAALEKLIASGVSPTSDALVQLGKDYKKTTIEANINTAATAALRAGIGQAVTGISQYFGQLAAGAASLADFGNVLLAQVGKIATSLGESLIAAGVGAIAFDTLISNPYTAITAGAALVAIGSAFGSFSSTAASVGSGSAGSSSGGASSATNYGQNTTATLKIEFSELHLRGKDFVAFAQQKEYRSKVTG